MTSRIYKISELASVFGLSRSTLLYYDKIGLLNPSLRSEAGYRLYSQSDFEKLELITDYKSAGLTINDIKSILRMESDPDVEIIKKRMLKIGKEIRGLHNKQRVLAGMLKAKLGNKLPPQVDRDTWISIQKAAGLKHADMQKWHVEFEKRAPEAHFQFLLSLGITEKDALHIRKLSLNPETSEKSMKYFFEMMEGLNRLGPGSESCTLKALNLIPDLPSKPMVLDVGCGVGAQSKVLGTHLEANIVAVDNHQPFIDELNTPQFKNGLKSSFEAKVASMFELPFAANTFDLIWSEGAIYIIGFEQGLREWRPLLKSKGYLAVTEITWFVPEPPAEIVAYWDNYCPGIKDVNGNLKIAVEAGYEVIGHFPLPGETWWDEYYAPLEERIKELEVKYSSIPEAQEVYEEQRKENEMHRIYGDSYGYVFYVLQKTD